MYNKVTKLFSSNNLTNHYIFIFLCTIDTGPIVLGIHCDDSDKTITSQRASNIYWCISMTAKNYCHELCLLVTIYKSVIGNPSRISKFLVVGVWDHRRKSVTDQLGSSRPRAGCRHRATPGRRRRHATPGWIRRTWNERTPGERWERPRGSAKGALQCHRKLNPGYAVASLAKSPVGISVVAAKGTRD